MQPFGPNPFVDIESEKEEIEALRNIHILEQQKNTITSLSGA